MGLSPLPSCRRLAAAHRDVKKLVVVGHADFGRPVAVVVLGALQRDRLGLAPNRIVEQPVEVRPLLGPHAPAKSASAAGSWDRVSRNSLCAQAAQPSWPSSRPCN